MPSDAHASVEKRRVAQPRSKEDEGLSQVALSRKLEEWLRSRLAGKRSIDVVDTAISRSFSNSVALLSFADAQYMVTLLQLC